MSQTLSIQLQACEICGIFKNVFYYKTPPLADSESSISKNRFLLIKSN